MRMSVRPSDEGFKNLKHDAVVMFNGKEINHCVTADEEKGYVLVHQLDEAGKPFLNPDGDDILMCEMWGKVELILPPSK